MSQTGNRCFSRPAEKQKCVASLKSQIQAPQALLGLQYGEYFKVYNTVITILAYTVVHVDIYNLHSFLGHTHHQRVMPVANSRATLEYTPVSGIWEV